MSKKRRQYTDEFKREAVRLVTDHSYGVTEAARNLGINAHRQGRWKRQAEQQNQGAFARNGHLSAEQEELQCLKRLIIEVELDL